jgi:putative transposase
MSHKYKIYDPDGIYFVTFTVVYWIDVFIRDVYREIFMESVRYCQKNKGLEVYAWVIMSSHVHMIVSRKGNQPLEGILRDMKSFTSRSIRKELEKQNPEESRNKWMYWMMQRAGVKNSNNRDFQFWQQHSHPIEIRSENFMHEKLSYIHENPVKAGFVSKAEDWVWSSARDYAGKKGVIEVVYGC